MLVNEINALTTELKSKADELSKIQVIAEEQKAKLESMTATLAEKETNIEKLNSDLEAKIKAEKEISDALASAKAQMALVPLNQTTEGTDMVAAGAAAAIETDHNKTWASLKGAEKTAYYREHKKEIDAQFK